MSLFTLIGAGVVVCCWGVAIVFAIGLGRVIDRRDRQTPTMVTVSTRPVNTVPRKETTNG